MKSRGPSKPAASAVKKLSPAEFAAARASILDTVRFARALRERDIALARADVAIAEVGLAQAMCRRY